MLLTRAFDIQCTNGVSVCSVMQNIALESLSIHCQKGNEVQRGFINTTQNSCDTKVHEIGKA